MILIYFRYLFFIMVTGSLRAVEKIEIYYLLCLKIQADEGSFNGLIFGLRQELNIDSNLSVIERLSMGVEMGGCICVEFSLKII